MRSLPGLNAALDLSLSWRGDGEPVAIAERPAAIDGPRFRTCSASSADGRWTLTVRRSAAAAYASAREQQRAVTSAVIAFTVLAIAFVWLLVGARNRALRLVDQKTDQLQFRALHDGLTSLPNRVLILERAEQSCDGPAATAPPRRAVPRHRQLQDDQRQPRPRRRRRAAARRRRARVDAVARRDTRGAPRWGRVRRAASTAPPVVEAEALAKRLLRALAEPVDLDGRAACRSRSASIGIAVGAAGRPTPTRSCGDADVAHVPGQGRRQGPLRRVRRRRCRPRSATARSSRPTCAGASARTSSPPVPADLQPRQRRRASASRRCCAGTTRRAGSCRPTSSSRWPRRPA